jgi:DNA-binding NarL/FixJ family response regulator
MTTVLLVDDDHPVVRECSRGMINTENDLYVVGQAGSGAEAVAMAVSLRPDVILMDLCMRDVDAVTTTERILAALPDARVLVVTSYDSDTDILRAVEAGAAGYLLKGSSRAELADAVRDAARGEVPVLSMADQLVRWVRESATVILSDHEAKVLTLIGRSQDQRRHPTLTASAERR